MVTVHQQLGIRHEDIHLTRELLEILSAADHVVVNRLSSLKHLLEQGIGSVTFLHNPIPVHEYKKPIGIKHPQSSQSRKKVRCLFIGRLVERRGPELALLAFEHALKRGVESVLWIVGGGELEMSLKNYVSSKGLTNSVKFFGNQSDVRRFLWNSDIYLATSEIANSPSLALREAMAAELAVIATDVEDTKTIIKQNDTGLLAHPDAHNIGLAIEKLVSDEKIRKRLGLAAAELVERKFDIRHYVKELLRVYKNTLQG